MQEKFKKLPLRSGVGIVVLNKENKVFLAKRIDNPKNFWQMPQGGKDESEDYFEFATTTDVGADATVASTGQVAIKVGNITSTGNIQLTGTLQFDSGQTVNEISDDTSLTDGAATALVTENAIKSHVSAQASAFAIALG